MDSKLLGAEPTTIDPSKKTCRMRVLRGGKHPKNEEKMEKIMEHVEHI